MPETPEKKEATIKVENKGFTRNALKNIRIAAVLVIGAIILSIFLTQVQNRTSEYNQHRNSVKILSEIAVDMDTSDRAAEAVGDEFNSLNQSSVETLASYVTYNNILKPLATAYASADNENYEQITNTLCEKLKNLCEDVGCGNTSVIDNEGTIILSSDENYLYKNMSDVMTEDEVAQITRHEADGSVNGTKSVNDQGGTDYSPVIKDGYYTYSTWLEDYKGKSYFVIVSQPAEILDVEQSDIKAIANVIEDVTVGTEGFLFAVDTNKGEFTFFKDEGKNLSGKDYKELGLSDDALEDGYSGYQTIDGTEYYCVSKVHPTKTFGSNTVIVAAISREKLVGDNHNVVAFACIAFLIIAAIVCAYGMILRRDVADYIILQENKFRQDLRDETANKQLNLTEDEIEKKTKEYIRESIQSGEHSRYRRINLGKRNKNGIQTYFSTYIFKKQLPLIVGGIVIVFVISFFSQTLLALENATTISRARIEDISGEVEWHKNAYNTIYGYIDQQYLSKTILVRDIIEQVEDTALTMDPDDDDTHPVYDTDASGVKTQARDKYGNYCYAMGNNKLLQTMCGQNDLESITIYTNNGRILATSEEDWYTPLSENGSSDADALQGVLDGKSSTAIIRADNDESSAIQSIAAVFHYYTYDKDGVTVYASQNDYNKQKNGEWTGNKITRNRGLLYTKVDESKFSALTEITTLKYILSGMHIYGSDSYFIAMDTSDEHTVLYSPKESMIGKSAAAVGFTPGSYPETDIYHGFERINGEKCYIGMAAVKNYFIATVIPLSTIYESRTTISLITVLFSLIFIFIASLISSISSNATDKEYKSWLLESKRDISNKASFEMMTPTGRKRTSSVGKRYVSLAWDEKSPEQKLSTLVMWCVTIALILLGIFLIRARATEGSNTILTYIFSDSWERGFNIFSATEAIVLMAVIIVVTKLTQLFVRSVCGPLGARVETTGDLIVSVLKYGGILGGIFYCLYLFGFDSGSLLTSAGILSVVIGIGAQSLIGDILAGIFIIFEGEFQVGDIVTISEFRGQVLEIGLRTTKIMDNAKNIKIFNNSAISGVVNMTHELSAVAMEVGINYGESLERVENVLKNGFPAIKKKLTKIIDGPFYKGVSSLGDSSVNIMIVAICNEKDTPQLKRDLNREVYLLLNRNNIGIPFPQLTVSYLDDESAKDITTKERKQAEKFVAEQEAKAADAHNKL